MSMKMTRARTILEINIFLKPGNLLTDPENVCYQRKVAWTLIFQPLSSQD